MGLIEEFIQGYRREVDFFDQAARIVAQMLQYNLDAAGIRAIVTSRAKSPDRVATKVKQRAESKSYQAVADIYEDIVDLAGVRVALYFPAQGAQVGVSIQTLFTVVGSPKEFPQISKTPQQLTTPSVHVKRFSGYSAVHYRVHLQESSLNESQKRYTEAGIEIQVASVFMHGWSEVEHDLVYKPLQGVLSQEEYAILDQLNGLVIAGEIALEHLQRAGEARVASAGRTFSNHYELAAYLVDKAKTSLKEPLGEAALGRIDLLYAFVTRLAVARPECLDTYLHALQGNFEQRSIAEQIVDQLLAEDSSRYKVYEEVRRERSVDADLSPHDSALAMGQFLLAWNSLERKVWTTRLEGDNSSGRWHLRLEKLALPEPLKLEIARIAQIRNQIVHGGHRRSVEELGKLRDRTNSIKDLIPD